MSHGVGQVHLVGAGPGDPGLITIRGQRLLRAADVVIYDRLVDPVLLTWTRATAELIDAGKSRGGVGRSQQDINALLVQRARAGLAVVRLKCGDPLVFGRAAEELSACRVAGIPCHVVSGVSSALAAPAAVGVPVTQRAQARSFAVWTAQTLDGEADPAAVASCDTLIILMGQARLAEITAQLMAQGRDRRTPALCVERATWPGQRSVSAPLEALAECVERAGLQPPVVTLVGAVAALAAPPAAHHSALHNRRIAVTRPAPAARRLQRLLLERGAWPIGIPLIEMHHPRHAAEFDHALRQLSEIDWVVLTSRNAAVALFKRLRAGHLDVRALAGCRIAAVGAHTARVLRRGGLRADLVPETFTAAALGAALCALGTAKHTRVLIPSSDAGGSLAGMLGAVGMQVLAPVAYHNRMLEPSYACRRALAAGVDAVLFHSPSAVRSFCAAGLEAPRAALVCIGPTTAAAAREAGLKVAVTASCHSDDGLLEAMDVYFSTSAVARADAQAPAGTGGKHPEADSGVS